MIALALCACESQYVGSDIVVIDPDVPRTGADFRDDPADFQFAIVSDRTGIHRDGVFRQALEQVNLFQPAFVISVGDLIEGYTEDRDRIAAMRKGCHV
jgi:hypothetical protein